MRPESRKQRNGWNRKEKKWESRKLQDKKGREKERKEKGHGKKRQNTKQGIGKAKYTAKENGKDNDVAIRIRQNSGERVFEADPLMKTYFFVPSGRPRNVFQLDSERIPSILLLF